MESQWYVHVEPINLPDEVVDFFLNKGLYVPPRQDTSGLTYAGILGPRPEEVPPRFFNDPVLINSTEEYPFKNIGSKNRKVAEKNTKLALTVLFGPGKYTQIKKAYMIGTHTMPVKVRCLCDGNTDRTIYVKRPDTNRIIIKYLYDIISGLRPTKHVFNELVFIEEAIEGNVLSRLPERIFLKSRDYLEGLVKASVHANFLRIADVGQKRNRIVSNRQTVLFDFNFAFMKPQDELVEEYVELMDDALFDVFVAEHHNVVERIESQEEEIFHLVRVAGEMRDETKMSLDERVEKWYGFPSFEAYFIETMRLYRRM